MALANHAPAVVLTQRMRKHFEPIIPTIQELRRAGRSLEEIAKALNAASVTTLNGKSFTRANLCWLLTRSSIRSQFAA